jgi:ABC-type multidrug transport system fused ATPase/permease subunit
MLAQDVVLTAIALLGVPLLFAAVTRLLKQMRKLFGSEVQSMANIVAGMQDTFHGIRVIRSFRLEDMMLKRMDGAINAVERLSNKMSTVQAGTMPLIDTLADGRLFMLEQRQVSFLHLSPRS